jgi:hypothetical protein
MEEIGIIRPIFDGSALDGLLRPFVGNEMFLFPVLLIILVLLLKGQLKPNGKSNIQESDEVQGDDNEDK